MSARGSPPSLRSEAAAPTPVKVGIRNRMKMVIDQLEVILQELKEVAKELKEVVKQIDKLTSDFDFELEPDDWLSSTSSSDTVRNQDRCGTLSELGFLTPDILSDSWEFCSFLELPGGESEVGGGDDHNQEGVPRRRHPNPSEPDYRMMNGGLIPNGPGGCAHPDSSSEETISSAPSHKTPPRTTGTRERVRFSDKVLYHALCCDDDDDDDDREQPADAVLSSAATAIGASQERAGGVAPKTSPSPPPIPKPRPHCQQPAVTAKGNPSSRKKIMRNNSTQTVSHKSTQTLLSYGSSKTQQNSNKEVAK
ncbi:inhibitory synaptic factor 1-like [Cetorhinus maximus]